MSFLFDLVGGLGGQIAVILGIVAAALGGLWGAKRCGWRGVEGQSAWGRIAATIKR